LFSCALALLAAPGAVWGSPKPAPLPIDALVSGSASTLEGFELSTSVEAGSTSVRARVAVPYALRDGEYLGSDTELGLAFEFPGLKAGLVRAAGLQAFLLRPSSAGFVLLGATGVPLRIDDPEDAPYLGASLGDDFGVMVIAPVSGSSLSDYGELGQPVYGAWASHPDGALLAAMATATEATEPGGPSWYDAGSPLSQRVWAAFGTASRGKAWEAGVASVISAGFPGPDAAACRTEMRGSLGHFHLELEAAVTSAEWKGLDGADAAGLRIDTEARYTQKGMLATMGYKLERDSWLDPAAEYLSTFRGAAELRGWFGLARSALRLEPLRGSVPNLELDTSFKPAIAPWLSIASSWRAIDGKASRFDVSGRVAFGRTFEFTMEPGLRFVPEGTLIKGSCALALELPGGLSLELAVNSPGWVEPDTLAPALFEYRLKAALKMP